MPRALRWVALFSGQGGQRTKYAQRLGTSLPDDLRTAWFDALALAGVAAASLDEATLIRNRVAQPTLCAWQVDTWRTLATALPPPALVAGYSVGELGACCAAGGFSDVQAIAFATLRAEFMDAATEPPAGLAAVLGLSAREVDTLCERAGTEVAIRNGVRHFVVGGPAS
ncbi:MAG: acyltransferase domain-containing protein, partial [Casimicrobiaceae bacterium]